MAITSITYPGNGSNKLFTIPFLYLDTSDIDVYLNGTLQTITTQYFFANATTVEFVAAPANGAIVKLDRSTDDSDNPATFFPGSSIKAADLNENFDQTLYVVQEINNNAVKLADPLYANKTYIDAQDATKVNKSGDTMSGNLAMGGNRVTGLGTPSVDADSATKLYVDQRYGLLGVPGLTRWRKIATAGQTVFSGVGEDSNTLAYSASRESVFINGAYQQRGVDYTANNGTSITFTPALILGDVVDVHCVNNAAGVATDQASGVYFTQSGTGALTRTVDSKLKDMVSVKDFGAVGNGVADDTAAIQAAQQASKHVYVPAGTYKVSGLRIYDQVNLIGAGYENTVFVQGTAGQPAINCTSDATTGQLLSLRLENFGVQGHASASVAAVKIEALGVFAIYRSHFDFIVYNCYQAINMQADTGNNVFYSTFNIDVVGTQTTAVVLNGGCYNLYDFFIAQPGNGRAIQHGGFNNTFMRLACEGQIYCTGQNIVYINPTIENLPVAPPTAYGFYLEGFNQTLFDPTVILDAPSSTRITYCIRTFSGSLIVNPQLLVNGTLHPFAPLDASTSMTLQGPGRNTCVNKMNTVFDGSDDSKDLRKVSKSGDVSALMNDADTYSGKVTQYLAPTGPFNLGIKNNTDSMIIDPSGTIALANINIGYPGLARKSGQTLSVYTSQIITTVNWVDQAGSNISLFPATLTAGQTFRMVYESSTAKWYPY